MKPNTSLNRRNFLKISSVAGGGILFGFTLFSTEAAASEIATGATKAWNGYLKISHQGVVTLMAPNPEIGQGIKTSMPMIVAEELDVEWEKVVIEQAPLNTETYERQVAGGSGSIRKGWDVLRTAGATARHMFIIAASRKWEVEPATCTTSKGFVIHEASGQRLNYGELTGAVSKMEAPETVTFKAPKDYTIIGTPVPNSDNAAIVSGKPLFGIDTRREGMRYAMVVRPPAFGKKLTSVNASAAEAMPGIHSVVEFDNKVAIVGASTWEVKKARDLITLTYEDAGDLENTEEIDAAFLKLIDQAPKSPKRKDGEVETALEQADKIIESTYEAPFLPHATMEPMNFFADVKANSAELYGPTQTPARARKTVSDMLNIPEANITVGMSRMGGGFGRRLRTDFVEDAAMVSHLVKSPVQVIWTREDDMTAGIYRPAGLYNYRAGIDAKGNLTAWHLRSAAVNSGNGTRQHNFPAGLVPNFQVDYNRYESHITTGAWRAPNHNFVAFSEESFIDEIAHELKKDPIQYRLGLLEQARTAPGGELKYDIDRYKAVIEQVAMRAGWGRRKPKGVFQGFGAHFSFGSYVAQIADISIESGQIVVHKVTCVVDCGIVINPSGAETQIEGGIIDGLGHALFGKLTIGNGAPKEKNFDSYRMIRLNEAPKAIEVHFIQSSAAPQGLGEPGLPPIAAAIGNAIFAATGKRIRKLPFSLADLG